MLASSNLILFFFLLIDSVVGIHYDPTWESLDSRPLPAWYDEGKIGIFIHWGVFAVPSFGTEWFWWYWQGEQKPNEVAFMKANYPPDFTYQDFAPSFTTEFYDPNYWAELFSASGAKYVVLTSKHHEGFTNWPSKRSWNWNAMDVGPHRDLVGELAFAIRNKTSLHFGLYHSMFEWFNPIYRQDAHNNFTTQDFVKTKSLPELYEIVNAYKPDVVWSDGAAGPDTYWQSKEFLAWLYNDSPVKDSVVVNDRWGTNDSCRHGGFYTCNDRYNPGKLVNHKWENCMTIDRYSWGYRRNAKLADFLSTFELISTLVSTVSCGGNILINVGPTKEGVIIPIFEERLRDLGLWMLTNSDAIYSSKPWKYQNDTVTPNIWYTSKPGGAVYAITLAWPKDGVLHLGAPVPSKTTQVIFLGYKDLIPWKASGTQGIDIIIPPIPTSLMPCKWAWVFKMTNITNMSI